MQFNTLFKNDGDYIKEGVQRREARMGRGYNIKGGGTEIQMMSGLLRIRKYTARHYTLRGGEQR